MQTFANVFIEFYLVSWLCGFVLKVFKRRGCNLRICISYLLMDPSYLHLLQSLTLTSLPSVLIVLLFSWRYSGFVSPYKIVKLILYLCFSLKLPLVYFDIGKLQWVLLLSCMVVSLLNVLFFFVCFLSLFSLAILRDSLWSFFAAFTVFKLNCFYSTWVIMDPNSLRSNALPLI